jgi:hypothetical protein
MSVRSLSGAGLALVLAVAAAADGAPRARRVPELIGRTRSHAESLLETRGFEYLLPAPFAARYEALASRAPEEAFPEKSAPDRRVVAQEPSASLGGTSRSCPSRRRRSAARIAATGS